MIHIYFIRGSKTNEHHWGAPPCRNSLGALRSGDIPLFCPGGIFRPQLRSETVKPCDVTGSPIYQCIVLMYI